MKSETTLRREGIEVIKPFDTLKVNIIAKRIADRLCAAFPEHGFVLDELFATLARLNMYSAKMPDSLAGAKYFYKTQSIYFNADFPLENCLSFATHECIHHLQEILDHKGNLIRLGLYDLKSDSGMAFNEATVQLMTAEANHESMVDVKYYGLDMKTVSPTYYPLECVLMRQIAYFTGTYPLYHSALYGDDLFQNTFCAYSDRKTFYWVQKKLDEMLWLESELDHAITFLQTAELSIAKSKQVYHDIENIKKKISNLFIEVQNKIIAVCFSTEFARIKNLERCKRISKTSLQI